MVFEEHPQEYIARAKGLGFDLEEMARRGQVRSILSDHLRREFHCISPDAMRFRAGEIGGWRASGTSYIRRSSTRDSIAVSLILAWDSTAAGGNGAPILTVDPGVGQTSQQVNVLLERLQRLRADIVVRLQGPA